MKHIIIPPDPKNWTPHSVMFKKFSKNNLIEYIEVHKEILEERKDDDFQVRRINNLIYLAKIELKSRENQ